MTDGDGGPDTGVYRVIHAAFKSEVVIASSPDEAMKEAVGGWDCGDYAYGDPSGADKVGEVSDLLELEGVGEKTVNSLLAADGPLALGPAGELPLRDTDATRLRNAAHERGAL